MATEFYVNQETTATLINDVAVDLGATTFNKFGSTKFGVTELNAITKELVGKGVTGSGYLCRPYVYSATGSDDSLYISSGTIIFEDGSKITLESSKVIGKIKDLKNKKVFAYSDVNTGKAYIKADSAYPASQYVKIAAVDSSGNVSDVREYATAKVNLPAQKTFIESAFIMNENKSASCSFSKSDFNSATYLLVSPNVYGSDAYHSESAYNTFIPISKTNTTSEIYIGYKLYVTVSQDSSTATTRTVTINSPSYVWIQADNPGKAMLI